MTIYSFRWSIRVESVVGESRRRRCVVADRKLYFYGELVKKVFAETKIRVSI